MKGGLESFYPLHLSGSIIELEIKTLWVMATAGCTHSFICLTVPEHYPTFVTETPLVLTFSAMVMWQEEVVAHRIMSFSSMTPPTVVGVAIPKY